MICSISGELTTDPVLSLKSRKVFDRKLIEEYIRQNGKDPITGEPMNVSDIVPIELSATEIARSPRKSKQDSIPSMLAMFQNEWDGLTLELFDLRKQVAELKKELSLALYRQDAAVNVATTAIKEKDEARRALQQIALKIGSGNDDIEMSNSTGEYIVPSELDDKYVSLLQDEQHKLFTQHKLHRLKPPFPLKKSTELSFSANSNISVSSTTNFFSYNESVSLLALTYAEGGSGIIVSSDGETHSIKDQIHFAMPQSSIITDIDCLKNFTVDSLDSFLLAYENTISRVSNSDGTLEKVLSVPNHIEAIATHPSLSIFIVLTQKCFYICYDKKLIYQSLDSQTSFYTKVALHHDGVLAAFGKADSSVDIFDICQQKFLLTIKPPASSEKIGQIYFALNGYWLLIKYGKSVVGIYDLRKGKFDFVLRFPVDSISPLFTMDPSSRILALGSYYVIYEKKRKEWSFPKSLSYPDEEQIDFSTIIFTGIFANCYSVVALSGKKLISGQLRTEN